VKTKPFEPPPLIDNKQFYRLVWRFLGLYFRSSEARFAWALFIGLILAMMLFAGLEGVANYWNRDLYNALQQYDQPRLIYLLKLFALLASALIITFMGRAYIESFLEIYWRRFLSHHYISLWLSEKRFYLLQLIPGDTDNPDQRLSDDLYYITINTLTLFTKMMQSVFTLVVFLGILWQISGPLSFSVGGYTIYVPGYLVWVAFAYAVFGTLITGKTVRSLLPLDIERERREGDLRYALARIREHSESIAFLKGEEVERNISFGFVNNLVHTTRLIIRKMLGVNLWLSFYMQISIILPILFMAPRYFREKLAIGILMQAVGAFSSVEKAFTVIVQNYPAIIEWKASMMRLLTFELKMHQAQPHQDIVHKQHDKTDIVIEGLRLKTPSGEDVVHVPDRTLATGESLLITGPSGTGKSTFLRALQGMWSFGTGKIMAPKASFFFLPQKPYLPLGKLADVLTYPRASKTVTQSEMRQVLTDVGLKGLCSDLSTEAFWPHVLSGGEQQRLGFARLLLSNPDWVFLDEATSALDEASENHLYALLKKRLPKATIISVGHRATLKAFHQRVWAFPSA
jgi:putative ATP-binding cassette transporter